MRNNADKRKDLLYAVAVFAPFCLLVLTTIVAQRAAARGYDANQEVRRSYRALGQIEVTLSTQRDAESAARGYVLTHNPLFLDPYHGSVGSMDRQIRVLADLLHLNTAQIERIAAVRRLSIAKSDHLARAVSARESNAEPSSPGTGKMEGFELMERFRAVIAKMRDAEYEYLESVLRDSARQDSVDELSRFGSILVAIVTLALLAFLLRRLKQFRRMITICAWTHQIKHEGKWVGLEEYFKDSFGFDATHSISDAAKLKFFAKHAAANPAPDKGATVVTAEMVGIAPLPAPKGSSS